MSRADASSATVRRWRVASVGLRGVGKAAKISAKTWLMGSLVSVGGAEPGRLAVVQNRRRAGGDSAALALWYPAGLSAARRAMRAASLVA